MSGCPEKDLHSIYLDGEMPEKFARKYEEHLKGCEKCRQQLARVQKIHLLLQEDRLDSKLDDKFLDDSFLRLQTKMRFAQVTQRKDTLSSGFGFSKWAISFGTAAAVFAIAMITPVFLHSGNSQTTEVTAIARNELKPIAESKVVVKGNIEPKNLSSALASKKQEDEPVQEKKSFTQRVISATNMASFSDIDVFRPDFHKSSASVKIEYPDMYSIPMRQADSFEDR